ncbi:MAG: hypothetical protein GY796_31290, partial [Chloroflexi bacterium]|nr:hypothetical protein [Chloroflexota bacterium]
EIRQALWQVAERETAVDLSQQQGINVFICGSLVGGTGSGVTLDLAYLVRDAFTDLGAQAEFCHITGVGLLPQAFHGVKGPNILPNTAAYLEELNHLMVNGDFQVSYPDGRRLHSREAPFDMFHVVDGVDQSGRTWADIQAVCAMAARCIYLQMGTQLGRKGENAFDNLDGVLAGLTTDNQGTFLGSFGKGDLIFAAPVAAHICTRWLLTKTIKQMWLAPGSADTARQLSDPLLTGVKGEQLRPWLRQNPDTEAELNIDLTQPGWLARKPNAEIGSETSRYLAEYSQARLVEKTLPQVARNGRALATDQQQQWQAWLQSHLLAADVSLETSLAVLEHLLDWLAAHMKTAQAEIASLEKQQTRQEQALSQAETAIAKAASSFPIGRSARVREALTHTFRSASDLYETMLSLHTWRAQLTVWHNLHQWSHSQKTAVAALRQRLTGLADKQTALAAQELSELTNAGVATISLADAAYVRALYERHLPERVDIREQISDPLSLCQHNTAALGQTLLAALQPHFSPVAALTVEDVIHDRAGEMTPRARRQ